MEALQHILHRNRTSSVDEITLIACLIAWATNTGIGRMGDISDVSSYHLRTISDAFLRPQTLREANDIVTNYIATLPIFQHYMIDTQLHSSSDGQKFETAIPTFKARYSPRYFGLKRGVVAYTLIANHVLINARVIGAHEHESHYVFDILFNNTTNVQPDIHSTDVHGINRLNFALLHLFGCAIRIFTTNSKRTFMAFKRRVIILNISCSNPFVKFVLISLFLNGITFNASLYLLLVSRLLSIF